MESKENSSARPGAPDPRRLDIAWPFFVFTDEQGVSLGYAALNGPVRGEAEAQQYESLARHCRFVGFTSFLTFPRDASPADRRYAGACVAWCHCFEDPDRYLPAGLPRLLLSYSDFTDYSRVSPSVLFADDDGGKDFDFVYVCLPGAWREQVKNWALARRCLPVLCRELGLRGLLVGREQIDDLPDCGDRVTVRGELPWKELMRCFLRARFLFVPNQLDASPRIVPEALAMNTPLVMNRHILGGWKYVNPFTGSFFESERDVAGAARGCLERWTSPRNWFRAHHGPLLAGARLYRFLRSIDPGVRSVKQLRLDHHLVLGR